MRRKAAFLLVLLVAGCAVPTTKYKYVPVTEQNFAAAQAGDKIPLVSNATALCFADARTALVRDAEWTAEGICGQAQAPNRDDDGQRCYGWGELAGIGIPYEGKSMSAVPMAAFDAGSCDPEKLAEAPEGNAP